MEVTAYRASLLVAAAGFAVCVGGVCAADAGLGALPAPAANAAAAAVAGGMVAATTLIHVYVTPLKRFIQALAAAGALGFAGLAVNHVGTSIPALVASDAATIWLVGPLAAAATGIAVKEGLCYAKIESAALAALLPAACLLHLTSPAWAELGVLGVVDDLQAPLALAAAACGLLFAGGKLGQAVVDDLGDKSVFDFRALPPAEREARIAALARRAAMGVVDEA